MAGRSIQLGSNCINFLPSFCSHLVYTWTADIFVLLFCPGEDTTMGRCGEEVVVSFSFPGVPWSVFHLLLYVVVVDEAKCQLAAEAVKHGHSFSMEEQRRPKTETKLVVRVDFCDSKEERKDPILPTRSPPSFLEWWVTMPLVVMVINYMAVTKVIAKHSCVFYFSPYLFSTIVLKITTCYFLIINFV